MVEQRNSANRSRPLMLTVLALSTILTQDPPTPPTPPEPRSRVMVMGPPGAGSLDKDGDGQVSREEFAAPMNEHFSRIDADGDGRLSTGEMSARQGAAGDGDVMIFHGGPDGTPGGRIVLRGDAGGRGMPHVVHRPGHGGPGGDTRFEIRTLGGEGLGRDDMDKDGDGRISEAEFTGPLRDAFARMDADRSGFIEDGERGGDGDVRVFTHRIETREDD